MCSTGMGEREFGRVHLRELLRCAPALGYAHKSCQEHQVGRLVAIASGQDAADGRKQGAEPTLVQVFAASMEATESSG